MSVKLQENQVRIEGDDNAINIVDKLNEKLAVHGLKFEDDGLPHDGFIIYALQKGG